MNRCVEKSSPVKPQKMLGETYMLLIHRPPTEFGYEGVTVGKSDDCIVAKQNVATDLLFAS
jgi:hypothetical protein